MSGNHVADSLDGGGCAQVGRQDLWLPAPSLTLEAIRSSCLNFDHIPGAGSHFCLQLGQSR